MTRADEITRFLANTDWGEARREPLGGDASARRYVRLTGGPCPALLMDAPPAMNAPVTAFLDVAARLRSKGLSAPEVYASSVSQGLILLEDFGDTLFARHVVAHPDDEAMLYKAAAEVLVHLHRRPVEGLAPYTPALMGEAAALAWVWYAPAPQEVQEEASALITDLAARLAPEATAFTQRDYHAENLLWLSDREGLAKVGLLDFQDAMAAPAAYDLVSLLSDARRDVSPEVIDATLAHYIAASGVDPDAFTTAFHFCGAQRNLRIMGVFARLLLRDGKPGYLPLLPRVYAQLQTHLAHLELHVLRTFCEAHLPAPDPAQIDAIKARAT